ncbi:Abi family protein [Bifidobacterium sp.]|uniref:Abi family protein n=2 Tax=Bifidobacterium sp. TaxID=41200 RepID=UPI003F7B4D8E
MHAGGNEDAQNLGNNQDNVRILAHFGCASTHPRAMLHSKPEIGSVDKYLTSMIKGLITDPAMPLDFVHAQTGGPFYSARIIQIKTYPKNVYKNTNLIQKYKNSGLAIDDEQKVKDARNEVGFYRLRGYSFHLYDSNTKKYAPNVTFDAICHIYNFDMELRSLLFGMTCKIEVALRSRFCEALLQKNDALIYLDPPIFKDKKNFWRNTATLSSEIARSTDKFITHNYDNHDGQIPLWAAVEVMSFGTLSKYIKNLSTGKDSLYPGLAQFYKFTSAKGNLAAPSLEMFSSWIHAVVVLRNICAHNSRIYNRSLANKAQAAKLRPAKSRSPPLRSLSFFACHEIFTTF